ncbi:heterokaryon incompatibility protein-domain-containing protein [Podospora australis]|uniref:Heterokaryon incompatibility protein-domain-containing protein n=1 Tax=Podospora australis TaxID=1536484 RepID=A0AAN7ADF0_9PEZI|nr:heterokaryon incompatibility protein-domain-containing protein [Podospora australis]
MRVINTKTFKIEEFHGSNIPRYAILSHTWEEEEVSFQQFTQLSRGEMEKLKGFSKINNTCRLALDSGIEWAWVDTCCIDKTSSAELTEAINSMFRWYSDAEVCYAWLSDLETGGKTAYAESKWKDNASKETEEQAAEQGRALDKEVKKYAHCRWFTRGWTLQELIAPARLGFYNRNWELQGEKSHMSAVLATITGISELVLLGEDSLASLSVAQRMSWAAKRETTRTEDMVYCLLGIFDVQLPLLYGEGSKAFTRLQDEIIRATNDLSLFAWRVDANQARSQKHWGILAPSPREFADCASIDLWVDPMLNSECVMTSKGLRVTPVPGGGLRLGEVGTYVMNLEYFQHAKHIPLHRNASPRIMAHHETF